MTRADAEHPLTYRPDIDGLRALAVLAVLAYHYRIPGFAGGFVGVDVFFVISGYLITAILVNDIDRGRFGLLAFFERRARRLLPALFATCGLTFATAAWIMSPEHLALAGASTVAAVFSVSNILFWWESGYFDAASTVKPLLHTWSLGVEVQFYLVWPFVVLGLARSGRLGGILLVAIILVGTAVAEFMVARSPEAAFFLTPFRFGEFATGALLLHLPVAPRAVANFGYAIGLAAIAASVHLYAEATPFPGVSALVPCMGAFLVIWSRQAAWVGLTANAVMSGSGRISYSVYLIHWPLLVLFEYGNDAPATPVQLVAMALCSVALGWASHRWIELPFRRRRQGRSLRLPVLAVLPAALCAVAGHAAVTDGWPWRVAPEIRAFLVNLKQRQQDATTYEAEFEKPFGASADRKILILGDSHSYDFFNAVHLHRESYPGVEFRRLYLADFCLFALFGQKPPADMATSRVERCREAVEHDLDSPLLGQADTLIFSTRWREESLDRIGLLADWALARKKRLVILGSTAEFRPVPDLALRYGRLDGLNEYVTARRDRTVDARNEKLARLAADYTVTYLDKASLICAPAPGVCTIVDPDKNLLINDYSHWSLAGARFYGQRMVERDFLGPVFGPQPVASAQ